MSVPGRFDLFDEWTANRTIETIGTNSGSPPLPFQRWFHFKEAFAPELVRRAVEESRIDVRTVLDPFGGSGTTAIGAQLLGAVPTLIEVNPLVADLAEAKLETYDLAGVAVTLDAVVKGLNVSTRPFEPSAEFIARLPRTFVQPGRGERWIFGSELAGWIEAAIRAIEDIPEATHARLARVLLAGTLVPLSNIRVSGKGRRYRGHWATSERDTVRATALLKARFDAAIDDLAGFDVQRERSFLVARGDARKVVLEESAFDLAVFSPPYPNSFDYTDVYNVELWVLGYLGNAIENRTLRQATLTSHVQVSREFAAPPAGSPALDACMEALNTARPDLWDPRLPSMVGAYFHELIGVLVNVSRGLKAGGCSWVVVGDSSYAGIAVPVSKILAELAEASGLTVRTCEAFRSMRSSPQQGASRNLPESLLVIGR